MPSSLRKALAAGVAGALLAAVPGAAAPTNVQRARVAARYIGSNQEKNGSIPGFSPIGGTADAIVALVVARRAPKRIKRALRFLARKVRNDKVEGIGLTAKVALAARAGGRNPRKFGGRNLIKSIRSTEENDGRYGAGTTVFDHALGMLAVATVNQPSSKATGWLAAAQCGDGGWQFDTPPGPDDDEHCFDATAESDFFLSDTNTSALAVQALAVGSGPSAPARDPFEFFDSIRDPEFKGWGYSWGFQTTDANSTALVLQAHAAVGRDVPAGGGRALKKLQYGLCRGSKRGAFAFTWTDNGDGTFSRSGPDLGATIGAVPGVLRAPLPVAPAAVTKAPPTRVCKK